MHSFEDLSLDRDWFVLPWFLFSKLLLLTFLKKPRRFISTMTISSGMRNSLSFIVNAAGLSFFFGFVEELPYCSYSFGLVAKPEGIASQ